MKTFEVLLTKSYIVRVKAENSNLAKEFSQIYTSDIKDLSTEQERENHKFITEDIECKINEVFEVIKLNN
ncbi:MAG: hypothetical protein L3J74_15755 [Bacteroidales bacterium]|nr:hypothetical protein [Bacteroidales bacterium]